MALASTKGPVSERNSLPLTTPSSAKPEPTLIIVGMMSNFPACVRQEENQSGVMVENRVVGGSLSWRGSREG